MIRFYRSNILRIGYDRIDTVITQNFFLDHINDIVCVTGSVDEYVGIITYYSFLHSKDIYESIKKDFLVLDQKIWSNGRNYFKEHGEENFIPVLDKDHQLVFFAWQDIEANREIRMLQEMCQQKEILNFRDLYPNYTGVIIHDCNELAWFMMEYLKKAGLWVSVDGDIWEKLGVTNDFDFQVKDSYEIWAEGVCQKNQNWKRIRMRSVSAEFECVDEIYEANIKAGKISDTDGNYLDLIKRLKKEKYIVIRGTGTLAHDAYNWMLVNGIDIGAFQSDKKNENRKYLFGKPILKRKQIDKIMDAVIIECSFKHSAWGVGNVDDYSYEGYERNKRYFLLKDYIEVPENSISEILKNKKLILMGELLLCNRLYKWWRQKNYLNQIEYWNLLEDEEIQNEELVMPLSCNDRLVKEETIYLLIAPQSASKEVMKKTAAEKYNKYIEKLGERGIDDYTDYFSDLLKFIHLELEKDKYQKKELRPAGILLGAIPAYSGNVLLKQCLAGHPQIVMIEGGKYWNKGVFLDMALYSFCVRLAEEKSCNILNSFWKIYEQEVGLESVSCDFPNKEEFERYINNFLCQYNSFTSQELFVMFLLAYEVMYGKKINNIGNVVLYWEPHHWERKYVREWAFWLNSEQIKGYTISIARNRYIRAGSAIRFQTELNWQLIYNCMFCDEEIKYKEFENWEQCTIKFEELKCNPKVILTQICEWLGISWSDTLMETTFHGKEVYFGNITGFDVKPAYNLYEEYFSDFDRLRIAMVAGSYQKKFGYPYTKTTEFSRRELQEMYLKEYHWEKTLKLYAGNEDENMWHMQNYIRHLLWLQRYVETIANNK